MSGERGSIHRLLAVELMHPEISASTELRAMFRAEARIATRLRHQFLCDVHDVGEADGMLYLAMEYLEGISPGDAIRARTAPRQRVRRGHLARVFANLAEGLHAIHSSGNGGFVERDISPQNLLIVRGRRWSRRA